MSVYKHDYRAYTGKVTPRGRASACSRAMACGSLVVEDHRWALHLLPASLASFLLFGIYLANNPARSAARPQRQLAVLAIDASFFLKMLETQCWLALVLASWIAPRLITFDLADNALPILLSHPISRFGYVFGKFIALFASLSLVTWIPCLCSSPIRAIPRHSPGRQRISASPAACLQGR